MKKRLLSMMLILCMMLAMLPTGQLLAEEPTSGRFGVNENLTWTLDEATGVLTISGTGDMPHQHFFTDLVADDMPIRTAPWYGSDKIKEVVVEEGVTSIMYRAFANCENLEKVTLPSTLTSIEHEAFKKTKFYNTESNWTDGTLMIGNYLIAVEDRNDSFEFEIPAGTTLVAGGTFKNCEHLAGVTIPEGVKTIGVMAFAGCTDLTEVKLPSTVTKIDEGAFSSCISIKKFQLPDGITEIGNDAFSNCSALESVNIPNSLLSFSPGIFQECGSLWEITVGEENPSYCTEGGFVYSKDKKTLVMAPRTVKQCGMPIEGITTIGRYAFLGCNYLDQMTLWDGLTTIDYGAFWDCLKLASVEIPESVTKIEDEAFGTYKDSFDFTIYGAVGSAAEAFANRYLDIKFVEAGTIPEEEPKDVITEPVKGTYGNLTWVIDTDYVLTVQGTGDMKRFERGKGFEPTPEDKAWQDYAPVIRKVVIGDGITSIGDYAFSAYPKLESVTLPKSLKRIGNSAFESDLALKTIAIPDSVEKIGSYAFAYTGYYYDKANWKDGLLYNGKWVLDVDNQAENVTVADGTIGIADVAFQDGLVKKVTLPASVKYIGWYAFYWCEELTEINLPEGLLTIGDSAFSNCKSLAALQIPESVTEVGSPILINTAYEQDAKNWKDGILYCSGWVIYGSVDTEKEETRGKLAENIVFPEGTKGISAHAFDMRGVKDFSIKSVTMPKSMIAIGDYAFFECKDLKAVELTAKVTKIGRGAFGYYNNTGSNWINFDDPTLKLGKVEGFTLTCREKSAAETYADANGFTKVIPTMAQLAAVVDKEITGEITNAKAGETVAVEVVDKVEISKDVISAAKEKGVGLEITSTAGSKVVWKFDNITNEVAFNPVVEVDEEIPEITDTLKEEKLPETVKFTPVSFKHDGVLPGEAVVELPLPKEKFVEGANVYLYFFNPEKKLFDLVDSSVCKNGGALFNMSHCSDYIVTTEKLPETLTIVEVAGDPVKTGDVNRTVWGLLLLAGAAVLVIACRRRKEMYM